MRRPVSSYRLQFGPEFSFADARALVPYLASLGVTECYCSPFLQARPGSSHGYDVSNHNRISEALGGEPEYIAFSDALARHGLGQIVDFVPNHMGIDLASNPWWRDVVENGPSSQFADFFDIDWHPVKAELRNKLLLPILSDQYGAVLERGELQLVFEDGAIAVRYGDERVPIDPRQQPMVLAEGLDALRLQLAEHSTELRELEAILAILRGLPSYTTRDPNEVAARRAGRDEARRRLVALAASAPAVREHIAGAVARFNGEPGVAASFDRLHELLETQPYRLASWRVASDEINYRRFFDINDLAGLRVEQPAVRDAIHGLLWRLIDEGRVTGVRIDHIDGLFDPQGYLAWLRSAAPRPVYLVVEKILSGRETLPDDWPVDGMTGYGFLNDVTGLFIDRERAARLRRVYVQVTDRREPFTDIAYEGKRLIERTALASELNVLAHALNQLSERERACRDFTLNTLRKALAEVVANCPVYRTYVRAGSIAPADRDAIALAIARSRHRTPAFEASIFDFVAGALLPEGPAGQPGSGRLTFAMKFQQYTAPVQAKGIEDTALYRYHLLVALNEVGGDPPRFGRSPDEFHDANQLRLSRWPLSMTATATHDTKRGEDARGRIAVISEIVDDWRREVSQWLRLNAAHRTVVDSEPAPDRNDEYLFYQALAGAWPAEPASAPLPAAAPPEFIERAAAFMRKATKEAKVHTSWINPNAAYDDAVARYVQRTLGGKRAPRFLAAFVPFARRLARLGLVNSLAQLTLKIASPGVPDFYQGTELWDLSFVDPDNRRPVDYATRAAALQEAEPWLAGIDRGESARTYVGELLERWTDGRLKLFLTAAGLRARRAAPELFLDGEYLPLDAEGPGSRHLVAFARRLGPAVSLAIVPRLTARFESGGTGPVGEQAWSTTRLPLPDALGAPTWRNLFTGEAVAAAASAAGATLALRDVLATCPVALLRAD
jgi:(1->4)-alpha-D-glucan 1-alpha-D-glucosylmutase